MNRKFSKYLKAFVFLGDLLVFNSLLLILYVKGHFIILTWNASWLSFLALLNVAWIIITFYANPYRFTRVKSNWEVFLETSYAVFQHFLITCTVIYLFDFELVHQWGPLALYAAIFCMIITWRFLFLHLLRRYRSKGYNFRNVIIIGYGHVAKQLEKFLISHPELGYKFLGFFDESSNQPVMGKIKDVESFVQENSVDEIYCCLPYIKYGEAKRIVDWAESNLIKVKMITDFRSFSSKMISLERYGQIPVLDVSYIPLDDRRSQVAKRIFDIFFSLMVIVFVFSWLLPIIAVLIKIDSKGPIFFKQKRTGINNSSFNCWKFRTMTVNQFADMKQAVKGDNRITKLGSILRKTSIDELPQFFNVLGGSMSVVGPRPHMIKHTEEYSKIISKFMARHFVKPGITGLAQAKGFRGETKTIQEMHNRVRLDRYYVENWTFWLDIKIIFLTVVSLIRGSDKAY